MTVIDITLDNRAGQANITSPNGRCGVLAGVPLPCGSCPRSEIRLDDGWRELATADCCSERADERLVQKILENRVRLCEEPIERLCEAHELGDSANGSESDDVEAKCIEEGRGIRL